MPLRKLLSRVSSKTLEYKVRVGEDSFYCSADQSLLEAGLNAGVDLRHRCQVGACSRCKYRVKSGVVRTFRDLDYCLTSEELRSGMTLLCQAAPVSDLELDHSE